jgi:putative ABC transport system permease protein
VSCLQLRIQALGEVLNPRLRPLQHGVVMMGLALQALLCNKLRTFLTMLGVIIGVASVITMVALGQGASASVQRQIAGLGTNLLTVIGGSATTGGVRMGAAAVESITVQDADAIRRDCASIAKLSPLLRKGCQVIAGDTNWSTQLQGVHDEYFAIRDWPCIVGSPFGHGEVTVSAKVCVLGQTVRAQLFGASDPVGQLVRIQAVPLRVTGVLEPKGQNAYGQDQDDLIIVPYTTYKNRMRGSDKFSMLLVSASSRELVPVAKDELTSLLRQRHHIRSPKDDDFFIRTQQEIAQTAEQTTQTFTLLLAGIAAVSLLVGGIGIMNIMLVSVTERIREIGIRMAVGAHRQDILVQFATEAFVLSVVGGLLGILCGATAVWITARVSPWAPVMTASSVLLAFGCAAGVGLFFGYYPARRAASLDPIEALRHD